MSDLPPKRCPSCREEFLATATWCTGCDVALVQEGELQRDEAQTLASDAELVPIRVEFPRWIEKLAERLAREGIPSRVELMGDDSPRARAAAAPCALLVRPDDAERARAIDADLLHEEIPDAPADASTDWVEAEDCPACGVQVAAEAAECPECGLAFREVEE